MPDVTPPSAPTNITTARGDNYITISWAKSPEADVTGYNIYVSDSYNGVYDRIGKSRTPVFVDSDARNGTTYYYAITSYDENGNESELSKDVTYDTPRPEGINVHLSNYRTDPQNAGYDFSTYSIGDYNDNYTDIYFEYYQGDFYLNVWKDSDIQDMGYTTSLYQINEAPDRGWSPTKDARVIAGHTYVIWTWDNHYAKVRIVSISPGRIVFDWVYQLQTGNPELKPDLNGRAPLETGDGALNRL